MKFHLSICNVDELTDKLCTQMAHDQPRVVRHACYAIHVIAEQDYRFSPERFVQIAEVLLKVTADRRYDEDKEHKLHTNAYHALSIMIKRCDANQVGSHLEKITEVVLTRLEEAVNKHHGDRECELQGNLCVCLSELIEKFPTSTITANQRLPEQLMTLYVGCFELYGRHNEGALMPDALMAVGMLVKKLGAAFAPFLQVFCKFLVSGLQNHEDEHVGGGRYVECGFYGEVDVGWVGTVLG